MGEVNEDRCAGSSRWACILITARCDPPRIRVVHSRHDQLVVRRAAMIPFALCPHKEP